MLCCGLLVVVKHQFTFCKIPHPHGGRYKQFGLWICCHVVWLVRYIHIRDTCDLLLQGWFRKPCNVATYHPACTTSCLRRL